MNSLITLYLVLATAVTAFVPSFTDTHTSSFTQRKRHQSQSQIQAFASKNVESLLKKNRAKLDDLATIAPDLSEISRLRFALTFPDRFESRMAIREAVSYRDGEGKSIVEAAARAVAAATAVDGKWNNDFVRDNAPHAAVINRYISPKNIITLSNDNGDLIYVIRASSINDRQLMSRVSVKQMSEFFCYVKEVHNIVANIRSEKTGRLCEVVFANDISGVRAIPDPRFSQALTQSSQQYERL